MPSFDFYVNVSSRKDVLEWQLLFFNAVRQRRILHQP